MNTLLNNLGVILLAIAIICTVVMVITQLTKGLGFLDKIPTKLQVIILSVLITELAYLGYLSYTHIEFIWYVCVGLIFAGLIIAFICLNGWESLIETFKRFYKCKNDFSKKE